MTQKHLVITVVVAVVAVIEKKTTQEIINKISTNKITAPTYNHSKNV